MYAQYRNISQYIAIYVCAVILMFLFLGIKVSGIKSATVQSEKDAEIKCFWSISH